MSFVRARPKKHHKNANTNLRRTYDRLTERVDNLADLMKTEIEKAHIERAEWAGRIRAIESAQDVLQQDLSSRYKKLNGRISGLMRGKTRKREREIKTLKDELTLSVLQNLNVEDLANLAPHLLDNDKDQ